MTPGVSTKYRMVYLGLAILVFLLELAIATGRISGPFVRGNLGDLLVIVLLYLCLRALSGLRPVAAAVSATAIGFGVEALQYIHIADLLGFRKGGALHIIVGNTFSLSDLLMYLVGGTFALFADRHFLIPRLAGRTSQ